MTSCWAAPRPWAWENNNNALFSGGIWDGKGSNGVSYGGLQQDVVIGSSSQCYMEAGKQSNEQPQQQQQQQQEEEGNLNRASSDAMGLKLGKRTYFEDPAPKGPAAAACPALVTVPVVRKKQRAAAQPPAPPTCQVEGCNTDLTGSKAYHRRHRVCEVHSKTPKNIVDGIQQRFCQQCSRFHVLAEFDDDKRSCRRRLAGHNERRRKPPQPEPFTLPPGASIFPGPMKAFMPQQYQQHLLNGAFGSWPCHAGLHKFKEDPQIQHARTPILINASSAGTDSLHFHAQNRALQASIANEGIYQFFKSGASGGNGQASVSMSMPAEPGVIVTPVCNGALSLLSAGPWGSAPFIQPSSAAGNVKTISADYGSW